MFQFRILNWRVRFGIAKIQQVVGVNSRCKDGRHVLLWDFDNVGEEEVVLVLREVQQDLHLPNIYVVESSPGHFHAYCFKLNSFNETLSILVNTPHVDLKHVGIGLMRGYWTLRFSGKNHTLLRHVETLLSRTPQDLSPHDMSNFSVYWTEV